MSGKVAAACKWQKNYSEVWFGPFVLTVCLVECHTSVSISPVPSPCSLTHLLFLLHLFLFRYGGWWHAHSVFSCCLLFLLLLLHLLTFFLFWFPLTAGLVQVGIDDDLAVASFVHDPTAHLLSETSSTPLSVWVCTNYRTRAYLENNKGLSFVQNQLYVWNEGPFPCIFLGRT